MLDPRRRRVTAAGNGNEAQAAPAGSTSSFKPIETTGRGGATREAGTALAKIERRFPAVCAGHLAIREEQAA